jgi:hypothetical protein
MQRLRDLRVRPIHPQEDAVRPPAAQGLPQRHVRPDPPPVDDQNAVADLLDLREDMRGEQDGVGFAQLLDQLAHLPDLPGIQADGGLVEDQDVGVVQDGLG